MPGPAPKPNRVRRSMPESEKQRVVLPAEGNQGRIPEPRTAADLLPSSMERWASWWRSPMAVMWHPEGDLDELSRLLAMYDANDRGELSATEAKELRQLASAYGLTPKGRKELHWVIDEPLVDAGEAPVSQDDELAERRRRSESRSA